MKNPWKRQSKINPQREDGTRQINSMVLDALVKAKLPTAEMGIVLTIISKTWGFNKKSDAISVGQLSEATGFTARAIQKANLALISKRIIVVSSSKRVYRGSPLNEYLFNKHYDTWKIQDKKRVNSSSGGELSGKKRVNSSSPTIETSTIEKLHTTLVRFVSDHIEALKINAEMDRKKEIESAFNSFWDLYSKKVNRPACFKKFSKLKKADVDLIMIHVPLYVDSTPEVQYRKNPLTYLNNQCWHDEIIPPKTGGKNGNNGSNYTGNDTRNPVWPETYGDFCPTESDL